MGSHVRRLVLAAAGAALAATLPLGAASEKIDYEAISKIKEQGMQAQNSKVMEVASWLTDVLGPRLTGSPNAQKAGEWTVAKMKEWGLSNVSLEKWPDQSRFPRGLCPAGRSRHGSTIDCEPRTGPARRATRQLDR